MPRKRRLTREESKQRTRSELLRAASRLFLRNGFVATSLSQIAEEAALTKGAVYSNFESKEDLFLGLLQGDDADQSGRWTNQAQLAPSDLSPATGDDPEERARRWGEHLATIRPGHRQVALFLEMNAFALRSDRARAWVAEHNRAFFRALGAELAEVLDSPDADPETLGLVAQSIYVGLMMHAAFNREPLSPELYGKVYEVLAHLARTSEANRV